MDLTSSDRSVGLLFPGTRVISKVGIVDVKITVYNETNNVRCTHQFASSMTKSTDMHSIAPKLARFYLE